MNPGTVLLFLTSIITAATMPASLPDNQWYEVPNTKAMDVAPAQGEFANTWGVEGPSGVVNDWAGAAFDYEKGRMFLFGGGHCGYYGNEVYQYEIDSCRWTRLTDPTVVAPKPNCEYIEVNVDTASDDTTPGARHTYAGTSFIQHSGKFLMTTRHYPCNADTGTVFRPHQITWMFDPETRRWEHRYPASNATAGRVPYRSICDVSVYDSVTRRVYLSIADDCWIGSTGWWSYDDALNRWKRISGSGGQYDFSGFLDVKRHHIVMIGGGTYGNQGSVRSGPFDTNGVSLTTRATAGGAGVLNTQREDSDTRGQDYDRENDVYVAWAQGKDTIWILHPDTWQWSKIYAPGSPAANPTGMYNRMRYVPKYKAFVVMTKMEENVHFFKYNPQTLMEKAAGADAPGTVLFAAPNPFRASVSISYGLAQGSSGQYAVYSSRGALVRRFPLDKARGSIQWDTRDASGRDVATGVYVGKLTLENGRTFVHKLIAGR